MHYLLKAQVNPVIVTAIVMLLTVVPCAMAEDLSSDSYARKWLVSIGINGFVEKELNRDIKLDKAAKDFQQILIDKYNFSSDSTLLLDNTRASKDAIVAACTDGWLGKLAGKDDLAIVFINTFCFPSVNGNTYLCPYDADFDNFMTSSITVKDLVSRIKQSVKAKTTLVIFQTLFTGAPEMVSGCRAKFGQYNLKVDGTQLKPGMMVIASSKYDQPTWGTYFSDSLIDEIKKSSNSIELSKLFKRVHDSTVTNTIKDCKGCKIQSPAISFAKGPEDIKFGTKPRASSKAKKSDSIIAFEDAVDVCGRARFFLNHGKIRQAQDLLSDISKYRLAKYTSKQLSLPMVSYLKGYIFSLRRQWKEAVTFYSDAVEKKTDSSIYNSQLGNAVYETKGNAKQYWNKAYKLDSKNIEAVLGLAEIEGDKKERRASVNKLKKALNDYPGNAELHDSLSYSYSKLGKTDLAIKHAQEAVFLDDSSWSSFINLGALLIMKGSYNEAQAAFRQALELKPDSSEGYYLLAGALERTRDPDGAIQALKTFIKLSKKEDKRIASAKEKIKELSKTVAGND